MDKKLAKERMDKFAIWADDYMPVMILLEGKMGNKDVKILLSGPDMTHKLLDDLEDTIKVYRGSLKK